MAGGLAGLGDMEMAYVQARAGTFTDAEALRECGVPRSTFYDWPKERREYMRNLALERKRDIATQVFQVLEESADEASPDFAVHAAPGRSCSDPFCWCVVRHLQLFPQSCDDLLRYLRTSIPLV